MARKAKKAALTPEERLQSALVPEGEQPYPVPGNWCWVRLDSLYEINPKIQAGGNTKAAFIPMEKIQPGMVSCFEYDIQEWDKAKKGHTQFADGDVAFAKISPCFENRKSMMLNELPNGIGGGTTELIILRNPQVFQAYTFWLISTEQFIRQGMATYSGTVGQQRISMDYVREYPVPLAPFPEQQRIVARIESLFAKLDEAQEKVQAALDSFEPRKAAVLHRAFSGALTGKTAFPIHNKSLDEVCDSVFDGDHMPPPKSETGIAFLVISNVNSGHLSFQDCRYVPKEYYNALSSTRKPELGDVLYTLVGSYGISVLVDSERPFCFQRHMALLKPNHKEILSSYLWYILQSPEVFEQATKIATGTAQLTVPIKGLRKIKISVPDMTLQTEIVRILDAFFEQEAQAKAQAEAALEAIDTMKKSILAKAFRGELGTNDPGEESALELLKQSLDTDR